jgi:nucleotide-binding universal stress UspA family protein
MPIVLISSKLREGEPALEVVAEAKKGEFDVVMAGPHGLGRVGELFLGLLARRWLIWPLVLS